MELGISAKLIERKITAPKIDVSYPEIKGLKESLFVQVRINELIRSIVYNIIHDQIKDKAEQPEIKGRYTVACNKNGILSIVLIHDETGKDSRSCSSIKSITLDLRNACVYELDDLFTYEEGLTEKINALALEKIKTGKVTLRRCFNGIDKEQEYYFNGDELVIYYQPYRYTTASRAAFEIKLPLSELRQFIGQDCPLAAFVEFEQPEEVASLTDTKTVTEENTEAEKKAMKTAEITHN
jgi:hypothetical protein